MGWFLLGFVGGAVVALLYARQALRAVWWNTSGSPETFAKTLRERRWLP